MAEEHYRLVGAGGAKILALHGWFNDRRAFAPLWPWLDPARATWAFLDERGYGTRQAEAGSFTADEVAADTLELADALGWERFSLVGHSMGAKFAQRVLALAPERVERLVGLNGVPASGIPFDPDAWELFAGAAEDPGKRRAILDLTTGNRLPGTWLDAAVATSLERSDARAFRAYLDAWAHGDFHEEIAGRPLPVLVLVGAHDPALSAGVMRESWLRWYPNATLEVLADAGHYPADETPLQLVAVLERFLAP